MNSLNLNGLRSAKNLLPEDELLIDECVKVFRENVQKHYERRMYYEDDVMPKELGLKLPNEYKDLNCSTGWAAKTVDMLAERSVLDSFVFAEDTPDGFDRVVRVNDLFNKYSMATPSMLIEGVGFWTVTNDENNEISVNYYDACTAAGIHDWKHNKLKACLVINDFRRFGRSLTYTPCECVLFTATHNVILRKLEAGYKWEAEYQVHPMGECMAVPMVYKRTGAKPFGKSRISKAVMGYIDKMMKELSNSTIQSDIFSIPMKYVLGCSDAQYKQLSEDTHRAYVAEFMAFTTNKDGGTPQLGLMQAADMTPHIKYMEKLASLLASETGLPVATFGVAGNGYTSSDALRASTDDLVILAKSMNQKNAETMANVARRIICLLTNKPLADLDENEDTVTVHFLDPSMPSDSANADAMVKVVSAVPEFANTPVFWEKLGYNEGDRRRIESSMRSNMARQQIKILEQETKPSEQTEVGNENTFS